jgi:hypothetical protein
MPVLPETAEAMRKTLVKLEPDKKASDAEAYKEIRRKFIGVNEAGGTGKGMTHVYPDPSGIPHVGIGFNLGLKGSKRETHAREEWAKAFAALPKPPSFDHVRDGTNNLVQPQIDVLFNASADIREKDLKEVFGKHWDKLKPNERLAVEDLYFNGGDKLVYGSPKKDKNNNIVKDKDGNTEFYKSTNFYNDIVAYTNTGDPKLLDSALCEIKNHSNHVPEKYRKGLMNRRITEVVMLNTYGHDIRELVAELQGTATPEMIREAAAKEGNALSLNGVTPHAHPVDTGKPLAFNTVPHPTRGNHLG